jgi:hypothetical protein
MKKRPNTAEPPPPKPPPEAKLRKADKDFAASFKDNRDIYRALAGR